MRWAGLASCDRNLEFKKRNEYVNHLFHSLVSLIYICLSEDVVYLNMSLKYLLKKIVLSVFSKKFYTLPTQGVKPFLDDVPGGQGDAASTELSEEHINEL